MSSMVAEQTLASQCSPDRNICERAFSLPANRTSKRFGIAELALRLPFGVCGQRFGASTASERYARVTRYLFVDGRKGGIAELA